MNLTIGNYQTKHFDVSPLASEAFLSLASRKFEEELELVERAAKQVDAALFIVKKVENKGVMTDENLDSFDDYITSAEEILDELGELDNHYYLRDYHEANLMNFYEIDWNEIEELDNEEDIFDEDDFQDEDEEYEDELEFDEKDFGEYQD
jgi:hypothetical protein